MEGAKCLARGCQATENARGVLGHAPTRIKCVGENAKYVISCLFRLYLAPITLRK